MKIQEIKKIAKRAKLALTDEELDSYQDLNSVLALVQQINQIDTSNIEPLAHPIDYSQYLRDDAVTEYNEREKLQASAPNNIEKHLYLVPNVFDEGDSNAS